MRILAIDDDKLILELLEQLVGVMEGHTVIKAESGPAALGLLAGRSEARFDCFLIDMQMPGMDGAEVVRRIRALEPYKHTPIMMLTAMSDKPYIDAAFAAGAIDYMTKPFDVVELQTRLGLMESLAARLAPTNTGATEPESDATALRGDEERPLQFFEPITIFDVENLIGIAALENYVLQLSRNSLFGSACFAFSIRSAQELFLNLSEFEFRSMIADVAEVISDTLQAQQYLMAYAGNGVFVCVTDSGWFPDMEKLTSDVNLSLAKTSIYNNSGEKMYLRVSGGEATRLVWKTGRTLLEALAEAHSSAEAAALSHERELKDLWTARHSSSEIMLH